MIENIIKFTNMFYKLAIHHVWQPGKHYIQQKEDGTLIVDDVILDRDELNAMKSWQDLVDMGISKEIVGRIAREYGGHPKNVDVWLEKNSVPYVEEEAPSSWPPLRPRIENPTEDEMFGIIEDVLDEAVTATKQDIGVGFRDIVIDNITFRIDAVWSPIAAGTAISLIVLDTDDDIKEYLYDEIIPETQLTTDHFKTIKELAQKLFVIMRGYNPEF